MVQALAERPAVTAPRVGRAAPAGGGLGSRARGRLAAGLLVAVLGVLVNLAVYRGLNDKSPVLALARDVPAGGVVTAADLVVVKVGADGPFRAVPAEDLGVVVGSYAKVRMVAGTLLASESLQPGPLVTAGSAVVAVVVPAGEVPVGLRERSRVRLVLVAANKATVEVEGVTVGLPAAPPGSGTAQVSISVEVPAGDATRVAAAERTKVVLLDPTSGPAGGGS